MSLGIDMRRLMPQFFKLSKSTIIKGMQCKRYLYLLKHKPKEKTPHDAATLQRFVQGRDFEADFKARFPKGLDVAAKLKKDVWALGASYTAAALAQQAEQTLFEACFIFRQTLVMADVCCIHPDGRFDIYEVKNGLDAKDVFIRDMAIQYYVIKNAVAGMRNFYLVLNDGKDGFRIQDMTAKLDSLLPALHNLIPDLLHTISLPAAPDIPTGEHCHQPYDCEYIAYCNKKK